MGDGNRTLVLRQLAALDGMTTPALKARWRDLYQGEPPRFNRSFLIKRLAYRIQELAYGGLPAETRTRMDRILDDEGFDETGVKRGGPRPVKTEERLTRGTILVRHWDGVRHEVRVIDGGFEYRGMPYRSLSAVARVITGTSWNGPLFFGLRSKGGKTQPTTRSSDAA